MQDFITAFLHTYAARLKPSTLRDYRSILHHHLSHFENFQELNLGLEDYLADLEASGKRKNNILSAARCFVAWARRRELWEGNLYQVPRFPHRSKKTPPLNPEEARLVMDYSPQPYRDFFRLSILSGMRTGEALGLKFTDFSTKEGVIHIQRSLNCGKVCTTKTLAGERNFPLLRPLWELFERRRRANNRESPWFFYSAHRGIISPNALRRTWKDVLATFDISPRPLYATRHTFASLSIAAGEDPLWVAKVMGHSRPDQLFLHYSSYLEGLKNDGEKFLEIVGQKSFLRAIT